MSGLKHIEDVFTAVQQQGRAALMPYFTLGFPDPETSLAVVQAVANAGADLIELGVPFSDPLADGPTVQHSTQVALEQGMTVQRCLEMTAELRRRGVSLPLLLMGYYNPILAYGVGRFVEQAVFAGADGLIIPDLPPDEAGDLKTACQAHNLALVFLLAPTTTPQRTVEVASQTSGFLYLVSLTGVTGARSSLPADLQSFVQRVRRSAKTPLAVGFGISTPEQAQAVGEMADGVIVGSALVRVVEEADHPAQAAGAFVTRLRHALELAPAGLNPVVPDVDPASHGFLGC
jgi:tryptophan synthase alpha chain